MATLHAGTAEEARARLRLLSGRRLSADVGAALARLSVVVLARGTPPRIDDFAQSGALPT